MPIQSHNSAIPVCGGGPSTSCSNVNVNVVVALHAQFVSRVFGAWPGGGLVLLGEAAQKGRDLLMLVCFLVDCGIFTGEQKAAAMNEALSRIMLICMGSQIGVLKIWRENVQSAVRRPSWLCTPSLGPPQPT
jgi:hypothetical protein